MDPIACWRMILDCIDELDKGSQDVELDREELIDNLRNFARWVEMGGCVDWHKIKNYQLIK